MKNRFEQLQFKFTWRDYQAKFLNEFQHHLKDDHLHVVAPPGSGKTILGLEMALRLQQPTLVLAPTLTIRNQWISRLQTFFDPQGNYRHYSKNIEALDQLNFCTYQSLYALHQRGERKEAPLFLSHFQEAGIKTVVLDEAHHLKNEWWKALWELKAIQGIQIIALTATPPYDSSYTELQKYFKLCGPIDDEIAVPDLIKNGDLCPHQDFIHFSLPEEATLSKIVTYRTQINDFYNQLKTDAEFLEFVKGIDWYVDPHKHLESIYEMPAFFSSLLIFLNACGEPIQKKHLQVLGITKELAIPHLDYQWCQTLLQHILVEQRDRFAIHEALIKRLEDALKRIGAIHRGQLNFTGQNALYKDLSTSVGKFKSVQEILTKAHDHLQHQLRAVVLLDYIGKEFLEWKADDLSQLNKMAVVPLFHYLNQQTVLGKTMAVLTGSVVLVPTLVLNQLQALVPQAQWGVKSLSHCASHVMVNLKGDQQRVVSVLGELFAKGTIKILIGTKALLGEGWDAPSINTLILASYVGSFVSSNQMRGRAIRVDPAHPEKVGRIWHLACWDPTTPHGGDDVAMLAKRFKAFSGLSLSGEPYIENGMARMQLDGDLGQANMIAKVNQHMFATAENGQQITQRWSQAIAKGSVLVNALQLPFQRGANREATQRFYALDVFRYLMYEVVLATVYFLPEFLLKNIRVIWHKGLYAIWGIACFLLGLRTLPKLYKAIKVYFRYGDQFKRSKKMAQMLVRLAQETGRIEPSLKNTEVVAEKHHTGWYSINFTGVSLQDSAVLLGFMEELVLPINNPRYLLVQNRFKQLLGYGQYYAVPSAFGRRKQDAEQFLHFWNTYIGGGRLVYTRTAKGRKRLVTARLSHVLYQFEEPPERITMWT